MTRRESQRSSLYEAISRGLKRPKVARALRVGGHSQERLAHGLARRSQVRSTRLREAIQYYTRQDGDVESLDAAFVRYYSFLTDHIPTLEYQPRVSILVPVYRTRPDYLREALASVVGQLYRNWELCIVDDASDSDEVTAVIRQFTEKHPDRVRTAVHSRNRHISAASNSALEMATGDYVALLDHDDRLYPNSLAEVIRSLNREMALSGAAPEIIYTDERIIDSAGDLVGEPFYKPGWSPQLHLSVNYTTHLTLYQTDLVRRVGGFREGTEGAQDHDLMLRAAEAAHTQVHHVPMNLYQWRAHDQSTAGAGDAKPYAWDNGMRCVAEALTRRGRPARVSRDAFTGHYRIEYTIQDRPLISVVIPNRDSDHLLAQCVNSVLEVSTYQNLEVVIVDNGSEGNAIWSLYRSWAQGNAPVRVIEDAAYFNFGRLVNRGVREARGEYVVLLNNDTRVVDANWIDEMLMLAQFPEVGAVGAKLLYPNGRLQHGGIVGSNWGVAHHVGLGRSADEHHYMDLVHTVHESLAVTAAAMMVKRARYLEVGGLDETWVPNGYGDVDLCLRFRDRDLDVLYTPYAVLEHHESATRLRAPESFEVTHMYGRWGAELTNDPYRNPNLSGDGSMVVDPLRALPEPSARLFEAWLSGGVDAKRREGLSSVQGGV